MAVERKSSLRKAPVVDVVDSLTAGATETSNPKAGVPSALEVRAARAQQEPVAARGPGPGRPRSKRRMEPFSSKIEIELRDELDAYIEATGITITDFLDEAIRARLTK
ncbi:hypothetical protein ASF72_01580 [Arthrobacter sp. Leaf141]|uniref:hypothetical protein n=1 Tax=Arthrobacter sp. Leaf141 TaxID=1736273 RepID=UPI000700E85F|nr:hypothetical protein [Arthrobacter sp. Leaf141]KQQ96378.1 hypothetical protein ASF72_01580 [Arthrobacter sp. Leaf141]